MTLHTFTDPSGAEIELTTVMPVPGEAEVVLGWVDDYGTIRDSEGFIVGDVVACEGSEHAVLVLRKRRAAVAFLDAVMKS